MRYAAFIILFLAFLTTFSQQDSIIVKGTVKCKEDGKTIEKAFVHLTSSQGHRYEYKTDSSGEYRFHFSSETVFSCTVSIGSDKHTTARRYRNLGFLATKDTAVFVMQQGKTYLKNFELTEVPFCGPIARNLYFKRNSASSCNDSLHKVDSLIYDRYHTVITDLTMSLKYDPGLMIEIEAHASSGEINPKKLSELRAQTIKDALVANGINPKRLAIKGWGSTKLLVDDTTINKAKTKEEKLALHTKNQRIYYRITSWDFKE